MLGYYIGGYFLMAAIFLGAIFCSQYGFDCFVMIGSIFIIANFIYRVVMA